MNQVTTLSIDELVKIKIADLKKLNKAVALNIVESVASKTPVDTGTAQASWTPALNELKAENIYLGIKAKTPTKSRYSGAPKFKTYASISAGVAPYQRHNYEAIANKMKIGDDFYLGNAVPWIWWLENMKRQIKKGGKTIFNTGKPGHMVARTKVEWPQIVEKSVREVNG